MHQKVKKMLCHAATFSKAQKVFILVFAFNIFSWGKWMKIFSFAHTTNMSAMTHFGSVFVFYERMIFWALNFVCVLGFFLFAGKGSLSLPKTTKRKTKANSTSEKK